MYRKGALEARGSAENIQILTNLMKFLPDYLLHLSFFLTSPENSSVRYSIHDLYVTICDFAFREKNPIISNIAMESIIKIYEISNEKAGFLMPNEFQGCGNPHKVFS